MIERGAFLATGLGALASTLVPVRALASLQAGQLLSQAALFASLPTPARGDWVRLIMGLGTPYQKQIGLGSEPSESGARLFVETQIGLPGGACNPNTLKKVYLRETHFGSLLTAHRVRAYVANSGTILTRWGDVDAGQTQAPQDATLHLLDLGALYDPRRARVASVRSQPVRLAHATLDATRVVLEYDQPATAQQRLRRLELWHTGAVPFGVAKYRATLHDIGTFELELFSHGRGFKSDLAMSLETIRAMTPNGTSVSTS